MCRFIHLLVVRSKVCHSVSMDLNLYCIKGALALFILVSFSGYVC